MIVDMETVSPNGRVDVLAYRGAKHLTGMLEQYLGLQGVWSALQPHINKVVNEHVSGLEIPTEAKVLLSILQANCVPKEIDKGTQG